MESGEHSSWRELIEDERIRKGDGSIINCTLTKSGLERRFDAGFGVSEGKPFTAWSEKRVYFPVVYDGAEWVGSAPRDPCKEATKHVGNDE